MKANKTVTCKPGTPTKEINRLLGTHKEICFENGIYELTEPLIVKSNTNVRCGSETIFKRKHEGRMLELDVNSKTTKYKGTHDVIWEGGKFIADTNKKDASVIVMFHARNIQFSGTIITGCRGYHSFEINACKTIMLDRCRCENQSAKIGGEYREAIQIDFANFDGLALKGAKGTEPCYDGTHCKDITLRDCHIQDCPNGIGTHTVGPEEVYHVGINIEGCTFENIKDNNIQLFGMKDVTINSHSLMLLGRIYIGQKKKAHKLEGGKIDLKTPRQNKNITIETLSATIAAK